jgi:hypothetical protein
MENYEQGKLEKVEGEIIADMKRSIKLFFIAGMVVAVSGLVVLLLSAKVEISQVKVILFR